MTINIAIIGVGRWGVHLLRNFLNHPLAAVVAIADTSTARLDYCQQHFALSSTQLYTSWQDIRLYPNLDAVVVATPASSHYHLIKEALSLGYHVLAEKPLTLDPSQCQELTQLAQKQQKQLLVDHTYLYHGGISTGKQTLDTGKLGKILYGYASRTHLGPIRQDVDVLWDLAIHDLAIFNYWLGETPIQVQAQVKTWLQPEFPDLSWLTLTYPSGVQTFIHLCWLNPDKQRRLSLVGTQGCLIFDEMSPQPLILQKGYLQSVDHRFIPTGVSTEVIKVEKVEPLQQVCDRFLDNINCNNIDSESANLATQLVTILTYLSLSWQNQGQIVTIPLI